MSGPRRLSHAAVRAGIPLAVLGFLLSLVGSAPFEQTLGAVTAPAVVVALGLTAMTNAASAARWVWVSGRLGGHLDLADAWAAYYRAGFLNQTLPGGVLGDVQRAVRHRAVSPVVWERVLGQVALVTSAGAALLLLPSPVPRSVAGTMLLGVGAAALLAWHWLPAGLRTAQLWRPLAWSLAASLGHLCLLLVALAVAAPQVGLATAAPLLLAVLVASSLPINLAGWGPREGAAAGMFALAGLGGSTGITVATTYGVLSLVAALPGALLVLADVRRPRAVAA